jgi:hypothetical protein
VVSEPSALYPRKWGEFRNESFSFSHVERAKNWGMMAFNSETTSYAVRLGNYEMFYVGNTGIANVKKSNVEKNVPQLL